MKKLLLSMIALAGAGSVFAQFNKTFSLSGFSVSAEAVAKIPATNNIYFTGDVSAAALSDTMLITKLNPGGGFMSARMYAFSTTHKAITNTADNGLLLAAMSTPDAGATWRLCLIKYDGNLNVTWARQFPIATTVEYWANIDIEKVTNSAGNEEYYVVFADSPMPVTNTNIYTFSVAKVSAAGSLLWRKQYFGSPGCTTAACGWDCVSSLTSYIAPSGAKRVVIAGTRRRQDTGGEHDDLFYMTVDESGNIVRPYTLVSTYAGEELSIPDVAWDGQNLVTTYLQEGATGVNAASAIGLLRMDTNYAVSAGRVYWQATCENYGQSITVAPDGNYVLSGMVADCSGFTNPYFMKLNRTTLAPMYFNHYNINRQSSPGFFSRHITDAGGFNYTTCSLSTVLPYGDARVLVTNAAGVTCGSVPYNIGMLSFTPASTTFTYGFASRTMGGFSLTPIGVTLSQTDCNNSTKPDNYRVLGATTVNEVQIAPTLLHSTTDQVTCILRSSAAGTATVAIYSITGQKLYEAKNEVAAGENRFSIPAHFTTGINLVQIAVNGTLLATEKISVVE